MDLGMMMTIFNEFYCTVIHQSICKGFRCDEAFEQYLWFIIPKQTCIGSVFVKAWLKHQIYTELPRNQWQ